MKHENIRRIIEKHEIIQNGRKYMSETDINSRGTTVTVNIPVRTPEEQAIRDKEIEECWISIYRQLEREGRADFLKVNK